MDRWVLYAILAMLFAGVTSALAKLGLDGISSELGMAVRTVFVFAFIMVFAAFTVPLTEFQSLTSTHFRWLALSALTTAVSWVFYYKAISTGKVATVAIIDKGSFLVAVVMAWLVLGERLTLRTVMGSSLILAGLIVVVRR